MHTSWLCNCWWLECVRVLSVLVPMQPASYMSPLTMCGLTLQSSVCLASDPCPSAQFAWAKQLESPEQGKPTALSQQVDCSSSGFWSVCLQGRECAPHLEA